MTGDTARTVSPIRSIRTADGARVGVGDRVFSHYTMREHVILTEPDEAGWFDLSTIGEGEYYGREYLNGDRVCSLAHARRMGWLS